MSEITDQQLQSIRSELRAGNKIMACKLYKDASGASLRDAKAYVESLDGGGTDGNANSVVGGDFSSVPESVMDSILDELVLGRKLQAIKLYRSETGKTLRESKEFIEALIDELGADIPDAKGCGAAAILFLMISASALTAVCVA